LNWVLIGIEGTELIVCVDNVPGITVWGVESGIKFMVVATVTGNSNIWWVDDAEFIIFVFAVDVELLVILPEFVFGVE
jgi:hypothetical protein